MATVDFGSIKPSRVSQQVADQIRRLILDGTLEPGDKLPSERELSRRIGVGRLSLREGLRILESAGILETQYGVRSGTYVSKIGVERLTERFSDILKLSNITIGQLTEARLEIGLINLKYFVRRARDGDIQKLEECLQEAERLFEAGLQTREQNLTFHQLIAEGSKNPIFILLHSAILEILREFLSRFVSPTEHSRRVLQNHKKTLRYLKQKNLAKASAAMKSHIEYAGKRIKSLIEKSEKV
jgi:GntR family transcriptional repressor for pyruvate dehydrogenase complex